MKKKIADIANELLSGTEGGQKLIDDMRTNFNRKVTTQTRYKARGETNDADIVDRIKMEGCMNERTLNSIEITDDNIEELMGPGALIGSNISPDKILAAIKKANDGKLPGGGGFDDFSVREKAVALFVSVLVLIVVMLPSIFMSSSMAEGDLSGYAAAVSSAQATNSAVSSATASNAAAPSKPSTSMFTQLDNAILCRTKLAVLRDKQEGVFNEVVKKLLHDQVKICVREKFDEMKQQKVSELKAPSSGTGPVAAAQLGSAASPEASVSSALDSSADHVENSRKLEM